jgi:glycosyltransferase involved in cell wall biosynthesis
MSKNIGLILYPQIFKESKTLISDISNEFYSGLDSRYFVISEVLYLKLDIPILSLKISDHGVKYYKLTYLLKKNKLIKHFIYSLLILLNIQKKQRKINALKIIQLNQSKKNISYLCLRIDEIHRIDLDILTNAKIKIIIDIDDNHFSRSPEIKNFFTQLFFKICAAQIVKQIKMYSSAVFVSNENDISYLWDKYKINAFHIPNYLIDSDKFSDFLSPNKININTPKKNETQCLFVANLNYNPNFDGLIWLLEILKNYTDNRIITLESPIAMLTIVGLKPRDKMKLRVLEEHINYLNSKEFYQIQMVGFVENIKNIYGSSDLVLVPILSGLGTCVKTLEAISFNKPILTTTCGWRGLPLDFNNTRYPVISNNSEDWIYIINNFNQLNYNLDYRYIVNKYCKNAIVKTLNVE